MKTQLIISAICLFFCASFASAESIEEADKAATTLCAEAKAIKLKAPSALCGDIKASYLAASSSLGKTLEACVAVPRLLKELDDRKKKMLASCDLADKRKAISKASAESARGKAMTSPEVMAGQKAMFSIHRCADDAKQVRDGEEGKGESFVKTRNDIIALREENSKRHISANKESMSKVSSCVPEGHEYTKANERLHFIVSGLYQMAASRIEASEKEEQEIRKSATFAPFQRN